MVLDRASPSPCASGSRACWRSSPRRRTGKWRLSFDAAAPSQMQRKTSCEATIRLAIGNRKISSSEAVDLRARARGRRPCRAARAGRAGRAARAIAAGSSRPGAEPGDGLPVGEQQVDGGGEHARVERHVQPPTAACPRVQRDPVGPGRQAHGARAQPVEDPADRRQEAEGQRHRPAAEADHLPQHQPDHQLLEDDRLGPPVADVSEPTEPRGRRRDQQRSRRRRRRSA